MSGILVHPSELVDMPAAPECHIADGLLPKRSIAAIVAASGAGKSFLAISMALTLAANRLWCGHATESTGVLYVLGEGFAGLPQRVFAWCAAHAIEPASLDGRIVFCRVPFDITSGEMRAQVLSAIAAAGLTVDVAFIDTLSANMPPGWNENATQDMKVGMDSARLLRDEFGWATVLIHHFGHNAVRARGNSDFYAALDVELSLRADGDVRTLTMTKTRDFTPVDPLRFQLKPSAGSAILEQIDLSAIVDASALTPDDRALLTCLADEGHGAPVRATDWARVSGFAGSSFYRTVAPLVDRGFVLKLPERRGYVLTLAGQRGVLGDSYSHSQSTPMHSQGSDSVTPFTPHLYTNGVKWSELDAETTRDEQQELLTADSIEPRLSEDADSLARSSERLRALSARADHLAA